MAPSIVLKPGGGESLPNRVMFFDVEPKVDQSGSRDSSTMHRFGLAYCVCCRLNAGEVASRKAVFCGRAGDLFGLLESERDRHKATWVFAHNLGYDLTLLGFWEWLIDAGVEIVSCVLDDPPTIVTVRWGKKLVKFVDVMNYWRLSVRDLDASLGGFTSGQPLRGGRQYREPEQVKRDVEVIEQCILRLINLLYTTRCCSLRPTAASLSWGVYCKSFLPKKLYVSLDRRERGLARQGYYGGRQMVACSGSVNQEVNSLDVNSLYPYVMTTDQYPCRLVYHRRSMRPVDLKAALRDFDGIACVDIVDSLVPYPRRVGGGVEYLRGGFTTVLAGAELRDAVATCSVRAVGETYLYERDDLFSSFVQHFYREKQRSSAAGNKADTLMYKMILNSLHGKFAQRGRKWSPAPGIMSKGLYAYWWHKVVGRAAAIRLRSVAGRVEAREDGPDPRHCFPAISACITSNARLLLESDIRLAGHHNVLYCDTDSIHTLRDGFSRLVRVGRVDTSKLGHYRLLATGSTAFYWGPQHYRVGDHFVCSSIKPTAVEVSDGVYLQDAYTGVERCLETGSLDAVPVGMRVVDMSWRSINARRKYVPVGETASPGY